MNTAVVVGAQGVIGRYIAERFFSLPDWQVVGLSRRRGEDGPRIRHISVDLLDPADARAKLSGLSNATHVFYAAFQAGSGPAADYAKNIAANRDMLVNSVSAIERAAPGLQRVVLVTGTKYYGSHIGPFKTPAREDDPRHAGANYYFDQIDWLTGFQRGKRWNWTELRPQTLCGFAPGTAMSIVPRAADPQPLNLTCFMADKAPLWDAMVRKHALKPYRFDEVVAWPFGDYVFNCNWDVMSNVTKSRLHGFQDVVDSEEMFVRLLQRFRNE